MHERIDVVAVFPVHDRNARRGNEPRKGAPAHPRDRITHAIRHQFQRHGIIDFRHNHELVAAAAGVGGDKDSWSTFSVTGADVYADGSWAVSYVIPSSGASYVWKVSTAGIATGQYTFYSTSYGLGPMYWSQPAITWQHPAGAC